MAVKIIYPSNLKTCPEMIQDKLITVYDYIMRLCKMCRLRVLEQYRRRVKQTVLFPCKRMRVYPLC